MKITKSNPVVKRFVKFMKERHSIYIHRFKNKEPGPWTKDPILGKYKFTNVYRELDRVTIWVRKNIREFHRDDPNLWFMLCMARQINWPETLADLIEAGALKNNLAWPTQDSWSAQQALKVMRDRAKAGEKVYTGAYILNAQYTSIKTKEKKDKPWFTCQHVLNNLWKDRKIIEPVMYSSIEGVVDALTGFLGWGGFTAYEVACDLRYTRYLRKARDKFTYANAGPGAKRGLNRLTGRTLKLQFNNQDAINEMVQLLALVQEQWPNIKDWPKLELREIEHSLCEFDKYERVRLGQGRPRSIFRPQL